METKTESIVFGGGCFWCTEAVFKELRGVIDVMPGYAGGPDPNPTYTSVYGGDTGHAEVIKVNFNPTEITLENLLTVFFASHDPTTLNRQGNDTGTQYRSIILYADENQKQESEKFVAKLKEDGVNVVTEVKPLEKFFPAEEYHRDYFKNNPDQAYCQLVINPKLQKVQKEFSQLLKTHSK
ncbi:MAG: peptide-methionine (S)-S-oxide reductase MsrA [Patescibacteria group bacterium]